MLKSVKACSEKCVLIIVTTTNFNTYMSKSFLYNALSNAKTTEQLCQYDVDGMQIEEYVVLPYWVVTESDVAPFLTFILSKHGHDKTCCFFKQEIVVTRKNVDIIVENSRELLRKLFAPIFDKYSFTFKGVLVIERTLVILQQLEINYYDVLITPPPLMNQIVFATVSEILNDGYIYDYEIDDSVRNTFINNLELGVLQNARGQIYETPSIYYTCSNRIALEYDALFCPPKSITNKFRVRTFESFDESVIKSRIHNTKCGVIRVCVFLKRHRVEFRDIVLNDNTFDHCDSVSVLTNEKGGVHYIKTQGQVVALSHYEI